MANLGKETTIKTLPDLEITDADRVKALLIYKRENAGLQQACHLPCVVRRVARERQLSEAQSRISQLEEQLAELHKQFGLPDEDDPLIERIVDSATFDPDRQEARTGGSIGDWYRRAKQFEAENERLKKERDLLQADVRSYESLLPAAISERDSYRSANEDHKRLWEEKREKYDRLFAAAREAYIVMAGDEGSNAPFDAERWSRAVDGLAKEIQR